MRSAIYAALVASTVADNVSIVWRHEKPTGSKSLTVHSADNYTVLAESCGNSIGSLDFSDVDEHGVGHFTVGGSTFAVTSQVQDGVSCTRKYNGVIALVECSNVKLDVPKDAALTADCFTDEDAKASFHALKPASTYSNDATTSFEPAERRTTPNQGFKIRGRQQCHDELSTAIVGDGDPHQNFYDKQISEVINCGAAPSCSAGYENAKSYSIGFSASATFNEWLTGGFEVQKTWETGNQYTCYGAAGDSVCIWYNTAHTAYTVQNWRQNTCSGKAGTVDGGTFVMKSPNKSNRNGGMYCVIGACRAQGDAYWDNSGRAGGP